MLLGEVAAGRITPEEAGAVSAVIRARAEMREVSELADRLAALERDREDDP